MAINKKLIHFSKGENFDIQKNNGNILDSSICFIQDRKTIITHGTEYKAVGWSVIEKGPAAINSAGKSNGVYVVTKDGELVDKSTEDPTALGVAFISANQRVMIPKTNATDGTNDALYWGKNLYEQNVPNLAELADATAARADFSGKANTEAIIAGYAALGKNMDSQDICKVLETYNEGGYTDWYVPAAGQLNEIYTNKSDINAALTAISGTAFTSYYYWSSSEEYASRAWRVHFSDGSVNYSNKSSSNYVRFVRDLDEKKK